MLIVSWLSWWYGDGLVDQAKRTLSRIRRLYLDFSVPLLLVTLASPWRRIITASKGSLGERFRASIDNLVSRAVGFMVRLITLLAGVVMIAASAIIGFGTCLIWPLIPPAAVILIIWGIVR
jgi:hypothetical protein